MNNDYVRKLPKKTIILIVIMIVIASIGFIFIQKTKSMKIEEILNDLGYKNVSKVKVINKLNVEDKQTKIKSTVFKIVFKNNDTNKHCIGFIHKSKNGKKYTQDIDCK